MNPYYADSIPCYRYPRNCQVKGALIDPISLMGSQQRNPCQKPVRSFAVNNLENHDHLTSDCNDLLVAIKHDFEQRNLRLDFGNSKT